MIFFDVGANAGLFAISAAKKSAEESLRLRAMLLNF